MKKLKKIAIIMSIIMIFALGNVYAEEIINTEGEVKTEFELKDAIKRSKYNVLMADSDNKLESSYTLQGKIPIKVKHQYQSGSCWSFAFSSIVESSMAVQQHIQPTEISPMHIEYSTAVLFNRSLGSGAGPRLCVAYAADMLRTGSRKCNAT